MTKYGAFMCFYYKDVAPIELLCVFYNLMIIQLLLSIYYVRLIEVKLFAILPDLFRSYAAYFIHLICYKDVAPTELSCFYNKDVAPTELLCVFYNLMIIQLLLSIYYVRLIEVKLFAIPPDLFRSYAAYFIHFICYKDVAPTELSCFYNKDVAPTELLCVSCNFMIIWLKYNPFIMFVLFEVKFLTCLFKNNCNVVAKSL